MRTGRVMGAALLAFAGVCALPWMLKAGADGLWFSNSIFSVFLFGALGVLFYQVLGAGFQGGWKKWVLPSLFGLGFSLCMVFGACLDERGSVPFENGRMWISILTLSGLCALLVRFLWNRLFSLLEKQNGKADVRADILVRDGGKLGRSPLFYGGLIFLLYLPVFLAVYPGFFVYDAQDELMQVITRNFTTHHPLFHVLLLGGIIQFVHKLTGSYNLGIACYTLVQMALLAGIFGWCVFRLRKRGMRKGFCLLFTVYFGICPVLVMFSLCSAKDGLFSGMLLLMTLFLSGLFRSPEDFFADRKNPLLFGLCSLIMMLLRHNGTYAFLASAFCILIYIGKRERAYVKRILVVFAVTFAAYLAAHNGIRMALSADDSEHQEILTVPIQQLARVAQWGEAQDEDLEILYRYLPAEALKRYTPKVSDGVKISFDNQAFCEDRGSFWKLWLKWGLENPFAYLNAWFMTSYGYWYPDTVIDVYRGNTVFTYTYEDSSYFGYEVEEPGSRESKIPWLSELYRKMSLEVFQQKVPVVSMVFSPGFLFWVWTFVLCFWWYGGRMDKLMPYLPVVFCFLTVLLGPTYLVRYVVYLWAALPFLLAEFDNLW